MTGSLGLASFDKWGLRPVRSGNLLAGHFSCMGSWQLITSDCLHDQLQGRLHAVKPYCRSRHAQPGKDETELVGVQAGHETAHIFERIANCEGVDE